MSTDSYPCFDHWSINILRSFVLIFLLFFLLLFFGLFLRYSEFRRMVFVQTSSGGINSRPKEKKQLFEPLIREYVYESEIVQNLSLTGKREFKFVSFNPTKFNNPDCKNQTTRDFRTDPILLTGIHLPSPWDKICPVGCKYNNGKEGDIRSRRSQYPGKCWYSFQFSMENVRLGDSYDLPGTTNMLTEVPLPYYSWEIFQFYDTNYPAEKYNHTTMAAFISNCGPQKRLRILKELMEHGVKIDSYGVCLHNKDEPKEILEKYKESTRQSAKKEISSKYKFIFSPENSETKDYVTEKFFLPFVIGSIPVYYGAPNIHEFAPSRNSYIDISEFSSTKKLAEYLIFLSNNKEEYDKKQNWRKNGPSNDFLAKMDFGIIHSSCRLCLRAADRIRVEHNNSIGHEEFYSILARGKRYFKVRQRNTFYLNYVYVRKDKFSLANLIERVKKKLGYRDFYKIYYLWDRAEIPLSPKDLETIQDGEELEVVFLDANKGRRYSYSDFVKRKEESKKK